jgi:hypothetical protein
MIMAIMMMTTIMTVCQTNRHSGNACDLLCEGTRFQSQPEFCISVTLERNEKFIQRCLQELRGTGHSRPRCTWGKHLNVNLTEMGREAVGRNELHQNIVQWYCHALSDRRRVLDWQLDLLQLYTQVQYVYNWVSPDSLSLTTHDWIYHNNSAAIITAATLVTGELLVPFLPFLGYQLTHSPTQTLQQLPSSPKTTPNFNNSLATPKLWAHNWELRGIWPLDGLERRQCFWHWLSSHHLGNGYPQA